MERRPRRPDEHLGGLCSMSVDEHAPAREAAGLTDGRVYQTVDDPNDVVILLDMADVGKAKAFANSEDLKAAMQRAGVIDAPTLHLLEGPIG